MLCVPDYSGKKCAICGWRWKRPGPFPERTCGNASATNAAFYLSPEETILKILADKTAADEWTIIFAAASLCNECEKKIMEALAAMLSEGKITLAEGFYRLAS